VRIKKTLDFKDKLSNFYEKLNILSKVRIEKLNIFGENALKD